MIYLNSTANGIMVPRANALGNYHCYHIALTKNLEQFLDYTAYAAIYLPVRIIDLGQIYYRPPPKFEVRMLHNAFGGGVPHWLDLTTTFHVAALRNTGIQLPNEYVYRTNSL